MYVYQLPYLLQRLRSFYKDFPPNYSSTSPLQLVPKCAVSAAAHLTHFSAENLLISSDRRFRP